MISDGEKWPFYGSLSLPARPSAADSALAAPQLPGGGLVQAAHPRRPCSPPAWAICTHTKSRLRGHEDS